MNSKDFLAIIEEYAPLKLSNAFVEKYNAYDNSGVIIPLPEVITGAVFSLDLTINAVKLAISSGCNVIVTHHPAIYKPISNLQPNSALYMATVNGIGVVSAHLNLDCAKQGIDHYFASGLGAENAQILMPLDNGLGYGRRFKVINKTLGDIVSNYKRTFNSTKVFVYGNSEDNVSAISSFCGAGLGDLDFSLILDSDLIVSADVPHHVITRLMEMGKKLIVVTHYSSEIYGFKKFAIAVENQVKNIKIIVNEEFDYL